MRSKGYIKLLLIFLLLSCERINSYNTNLVISTSYYSNLLKLCQIKKPAHTKIIIDCNYSISEAIAGKTIPLSIKQNLTIVKVQYFSFDNKLHQGQIVINKKLVKDIKEIFKIIKAEKFPVKSVIPIVKYHWSDEKSMEQNNTSAFNYRFIRGTKILSAHALGRAIDINPKLNPQEKNGKIIPHDAVYNPGKPGTFSHNSKIVRAFIKRGWKWGGFWRSTKDYQHFQK
jgi:uncharacterized protein (UPF0335 family)